MKYLFYISFLLVFCSCEKQLTIEQGNLEKQLVVNATASNKTPLTLVLSENTALLDEPDYRSPIYSGRMVIFEDNFLIYDKLVAIDSGQLITSNFMQPGRSYEILLDVEGYPVINAMDRMPDKDPDFRVNSLNKLGESYQMNIKLSDDGGDDYYMMLLYIVGKQAVGNDTLIVEKPLNFSTSDKLFVTNINTLRANNHFAFYDDALLNGSSKNATVQFPSSVAVVKDGFVPKQIRMEVRSLSAQYFDYNIQLLENNHIYGGPLASASYTEGNIVGGLGFFGCYTTKSGIIDLQ